MLARRAWDSIGQKEASALGLSGFDEWRRFQTEVAVGKDSLRIATQEDFLPIQAHFFSLLGESKRAQAAMDRHQTNPRRIAFANLEKNCRERGLTLNYPGAICRRQYNCALHEATEKQIWALVYTVRNRRKALPAAPFGGQHREAA